VATGRSQDGICSNSAARDDRTVNPDISQRGKAATHQMRPYHYVRGSSSSFGKEEWIERRAGQNRIREGLIAALGAVEPCSVMTVRANHLTHRLEPVYEQRKGRSVRFHRWR
jgi:hypothetical protein